MGTTEPKGAKETAVLPPLTGLIPTPIRFPRLTPWANFSRPYGAFTSWLASIAASPCRAYPRSHEWRYYLFPPKPPVPALAGTPRGSGLIITGWV
jgi:hypothetical protein